MVIYEVNLEINKDIFNHYYQWLLMHVKEILMFDGFQKAEIGMVENQSEEDKMSIRVSYTLDSYNKLQTYLEQHASHMRAEAVNKFGVKFSAHRRVIKHLITLESN